MSMQNNMQNASRGRGGGGGSHPSSPLGLGQAPPQQQQQQQQQSGASGVSSGAAGPTGAPQQRRMGRGGSSSTYASQANTAEGSNNGFASVSPSGSQYYGMPPPQQPTQPPPPPPNATSQQPQGRNPMSHQLPQGQQRFSSSSGQQHGGSGYGMPQQGGDMTPPNMMGGYHGSPADPHSTYGGEASGHSQHGMLPPQQHHTQHSSGNAMHGNAPLQQQQQPFYAGAQMSMQLGVQPGAYGVQPPHHFNRNHAAQHQHPNHHLSQQQHGGGYNAPDPNELSGSGYGMPQPPPQSMNRYDDFGVMQQYTLPPHHQQQQQQQHHAPPAAQPQQQPQHPSPTQPSGHRHQPYATAKSPAVQDDSPKGTPTAPLPPQQQLQQRGGNNNNSGSNMRRPPPSTFPTNPPQYASAPPMGDYGNPGALPPSHGGDSSAAGVDDMMRMQYHPMPPHQQQQQQPHSSMGGHGQHGAHSSGQQQQNPMSMLPPQQQQPYLPPGGGQIPPQQQPQQQQTQQQAQPRRGPAGRSQPANANQGALAGAPIRSTDNVAMNSYHSGGGSGSHPGSPELMHQNSMDSFSQASQQQPQQQQRNSLAGPRLRAPGPPTPNGPMPYGNSPSLQGQQPMPQMPPPPPQHMVPFPGMKPGSPAADTPTGQPQVGWSPHHVNQYGMQPTQQPTMGQRTSHGGHYQQQQQSNNAGHPPHQPQQPQGVMLPPPASVVTVGGKAQQQQGGGGGGAYGTGPSGARPSDNTNDMSGSGIHVHETPTPSVRVGPAPSDTASSQPHQPQQSSHHPPQPGQQHHTRPPRRESHTDPHGHLGGSFGAGVQMPVFPATLNVPLVIGRHATNAVNRGGVIDATAAPIAPTALSDAGSAPLSGAASALGCAPEFKWFQDVQATSPTAVTFFDPVLRSQQCPRSGLLHLLFHISDRVADKEDPARGARIITAMAQSTAYAAPPTHRRWKAVLPRDSSFGLFHVLPASQLAASPPIAEPNASTTSRPSLRRPILVDGDLFVSNVLRALTDDDPHWHLVSTAPQMVVDLCAEAAEKLFVDNDWEPKFIFSGVQNKDCEMDSVTTTTHIMQQQDRVWAALKYSLLSDVKRYLKTYGTQDSANLVAAALSQQLSDDDGETGGSLDQEVGVRPSAAHLTVPHDGIDGRMSTVSNEAAATDNSDNSALRIGFSHEIELHPPFTDELRDVCATHLRVSMNFEVIRSPQFSWAQAASLIAIARSSGDKNPLAIYGPPEALLFEGIDTVVLGMLSDGQCIAVHKSEVLAALYSPGETDKAKCSFAELAAMVPESDPDVDVPATLPPELCDALAARMTPRELTAAWVDIGLLTSTHPQLGGFRIRWPAESPYAQGGRELLQAFRYRTLHPARNVPAEVGNDDEAMVTDWLQKHPQESGVARYRLWPFLHYGLDVSSHRSVTSVNGADPTFLSYTRKAKWRVLRGRAALKHSPVAAPGVVQPSPEDTEVALVAPLSRVLAAVENRDSSPSAVGIPKDLHTVTGNRLPQMLYYAHLIGVVRSTTLTLAAHGILKNERPVADSFLLRKCVKGSSLALCCLIFEELLRTIDPDPPLTPDTPVRQGLMWSQWFFPTRLMRQRLTLSKVDEWPLDEFPELAKGTTADDFPIDLHSALHLTRRGIIEEELQVSYETRRQFVAAVHLKLLDFLGYLVHPESQGCDCELSYFGKALADFPRLFHIPLDKLGQPTPLNDPVLRQMTPHYAQQVLLLIELVRTESLTGQILVTVTGQNWDGSRNNKLMMQNAASGVVMAGETEPNPTLHTRPERQAVLLASRIACLCPMIIHGPWRGLIDRDLTSFASIASKMQGLLRLVADVYAATTLVSGKYSGTLDELVEVGAELPMGTPQSAAGGCAMRFILDTPDDIGCNLQSPEDRLAFFAAAFPCLLPSDVRREAAKHHHHHHRTHPLAREQNDRDTPDPLGVSTASQHSSCCPPGCPDDDNIDVHHVSVLRYMSGIVDELFAFWDVCMSTLLHLRELVVKNESETGSQPSPLHLQLDALCETLRQANEIVVRKKGLFVSSRAVPSESDQQSVLDDATQESSLSHADA